MQPTTRRKNRGTGAIIVKWPGLFLFATGLSVLLQGCHALAISMEKATAQCKEKYSPTVRECVRSKKQRGESPDKYIVGCKAALTGQIKACISNLIGAAGLKNNPLDAAGRSSEAAPSGVPAGQKHIVAPRTTSPPFSIRRSPIQGA